MVWVERGRTTRYRMLATLRGVRRRAARPLREADAVADRQPHATSARWRNGLRSSCEVPHSARRCVSCGTSSPTSGQRSPGSPVPAATSTPPCDRRLLGMFWHLGRHPKVARSRPVGGAGDGSAPARARALQAVSIVERATTGCWCTCSRTARRPRRRAWPSPPSSTTPARCPVEGAGGGRGRDRGVPRALGRVPGRGRRGVLTRGRRPGAGRSSGSCAWRPR